LLFSAPCVSWPGIGREFACLLWSLLNTLRLLAHYWKRVCLLLWSLLNSWRWRTIYWRRW
jgi:hypothetical protein